MENILQVIRNTVWREEGRQCLTDSESLASGSQTWVNYARYFYMFCVLVITQAQGMLSIYKHKARGLSCMLIKCGNILSVCVITNSSRGCVIALWLELLLCQHRWAASCSLFSNNKLSNHLPAGNKTQYNSRNYAWNLNLLELSDSTAIAIMINSDQIVGIPIVVTCLIKASFSFTFAACWRA